MIRSEIYSSTVKQNCSWFQNSPDLTEVVHVKKSSTELDGLGRQWPSPRKRCRPSRLDSEASWFQHHSALDLAGWSSYAGQVVGHSRRRRGCHGEATQGSAGSENSSSVIISDDSTQQDSLASDKGGYFVRLMEDEECDTLWTMERGELRGREPELNLSHGRKLEDPVEHEENPSNSPSRWSMTSGPTLVDRSPTKPCKNCMKLFSKMRRVKGWKKVIDYDPSSLLCDQWVLKKRWRPRRSPNIKGKLWTHLRRIRNDSSLGCIADGGQKARVLCSRPHVFLHRNLMQCKKVARVRSKDCITSGPQGKGGRRTRRKTRKKKGHTEVSEGAPMASPSAASSQYTSGVCDAACDAEMTGDQNRACRVLNFDAQEPVASCSQGHSRDPRVQNLTFSGERPDVFIKRKTSNRSSADHFSWVREGGFRSLLSELKGSRSTVVKELENTVL